MIARLTPSLVLSVLLVSGSAGAEPPGWDQGRSVYERRIRPAEAPEKVDWDARVAALLREEPGDVIVTGTPTGAGVRFDPPKWLKAGDVVVLEVPGIVSQETAARLASFGTRAFYPAKAVVLEGGTTVRVLRYQPEKVKQ